MMINIDLLCSANKRRGVGARDVAVVTNDELRRLRAETEKGATREAAILTQ